MTSCEEHPDACGQKHNDHCNVETVIAGLVRDIRNDGALI